MQSKSPETCMGPKNRSLFPSRCGKASAWLTPSGPRCDACAQHEMALIREGKCLLALLADSKGVPRETLIAKYQRIDGEKA